MQKSLDDEYIGLPLPHSSLYILLALSERPLHGYALMQQARHDSNGIVAISSAGLARALKRLLAFEAIAEAESQVGQRSPHPRKVYRLTAVGRQLLEWELGRLVKAYKLGQLRLKQPSRF